jgi:hypothetical protein
MTHIGAGLTEAEFHAGAAVGTIGHIGLLETAAMVNHCLGLGVDELHQTKEPLFAERERVTAFVSVPPGRVYGFRQNVVGLRGGETVLDFRMVAVLDPRPGDGLELGDRFRINGTPSVDVTIREEISQKGDLWLGVAINTFRSCSPRLAAHHRRLALPIVATGRRIAGHQDRPMTFPGCVESSSPTWDEEVDVVVVGSGFAGLAAAVEARRAGAAVLVVEKMASPGGNSVISDGSVAAAGSALQRRHDIEDSPELMVRDMLRAGLELNHPSLARLVAESSAATLQWTIDELGVRYQDRVLQFGGHSVPRTHATPGLSGAALYRPLLQRAKGLAAEIRVGTLVEGLVRDSAGGILGARLRPGYLFPDPTSGRPTTCRAARGVVVAAGGFGNDVAFRAAQDPRLTAAVASTNHAGATAEILKELLSSGAASLHLSGIQLGPWASPDEEGSGVGPTFATYVAFLRHPRRPRDGPAVRQRDVGPANTRRGPARDRAPGHRGRGLGGRRALGAEHREVPAQGRRALVRLARESRESVRCFSGCTRAHSGHVQRARREWQRPRVREANARRRARVSTRRRSSPCACGEGALHDGRRADRQRCPGPRPRRASDRPPVRRRRVTGGVHGACRLGNGDHRLPGHGPRRRGAAGVITRQPSGSAAAVAPTSRNQVDE